MERPAPRVVRSPRPERGPTDARRTTDRRRGSGPHLTDAVRCTRREFVAGGLAVAGAAALGSLAGGCRAPRVTPGRSDRGNGNGNGNGIGDDDRDGGFPLHDVSGEPYAVGTSIGKRFRAEIAAWAERRRDWIDDLVRFAENEGRVAFDEMIRSARAHTAAAVEEARGIADGARIDFRTILALNCKSELEAARRNPGGVAGCSTIAVADDDRVLLAHNEDGHESLDGFMFLVRVRPPSGVRFLALAYPGIVAGNAPAINDRGIAMITNYIGAVGWRPGVPRYFLDRMALEARTVDEAIRITTDPHRGYSFHHVIAGREGGRPRAVAVEVTYEKSEIRDLAGVYVHTNHLILDSMRDERQVAEYVEKSSLPRYRTIVRDAGKAGNPGTLEADDLVRMLSSHEGRPAAPCRHPERDVMRGATLACAVFDVGARRMRLYRGTPCRGEYHEYDAPEPWDVA